MQQQTKKLRWLFGFCAFLAITSCHNFYKATAGKSGVNAAGSIDSLKLQNRYFILRTGGQAYYMNNMVLSSDRKTLSSTLDSLPPEHKLHLKNGHKGNLQYKKIDINEVQVLSEVHLYTASTSKITIGENFSLPLDQVQKIEVIEKDRKRTTNSYVIGAIGYTLGAMVVVGIIIAATKSSCPFVSAYDGKDFALQGEIYGGAIYPQMARYDYLPLKMAPLADGTLQLKISNELKEKQYTDFADLLVITHDKKTQILSNERGQLFSVSSPQAPLSALLNDKKNVLPSLLKVADNTIVYMDDTTTTDASNTVVLKFKKEAGADKAKLVLNLKNAYWLDLLYGELAKGFGSYYATYMKKQAKKPAQELVQWTKDQHMPLTVSVNSKNGWKKITDITTIGPLANRTIVVPVDLSDVPEDVIELKLSSGFMFWELDYAGLDFSADDAYSVEKLSPIDATDETGKNVLAALQKEDGFYLEQPEIGNAATIVYKTAPLTDASKTRTYILQTKGYYQHIRDFKNKPDVTFLKQFTKPDAFPKYGKELYKRLESENLRLMASNQ
jgi:hypothetical protein